MKVITAELVHEICDILFEEGYASTAEEVLNFIQNSDDESLRVIYEIAKERLKKKRKRMLEGSYVVEYAYIS